MQSLFLGLAAALAWGVHDLCVRFVAQRTGILAAMLTVLAAGAILVGAAAVLWGDWSAMTAGAAGLAGLSGSFFALATYALYRAFALGPVKLAAPLIGAYPVLSLGLATLQGQPLGAWHWLAAAAVVCGVGSVAVLAPGEAPQAGEDRVAARMGTLLWSLAAAAGFALTFAAGQAASRAGAELPVLVLARMAAILAVLAIALPRGALPRPPRRVLPLLCLMGALDALALGLVIVSGGLPRPEFAAVSSSLFGLITVILAWLFLREGMTRGQWLAVTVTFAGIACLGL
ncbi:EamA family transporter [Cribrihabitans pelagius]|uniref:EamA family transporter n=1 Tax=Cribrihabitans pelagius TaxID=1765746 RepID=UPI003B599D48